MLTASSTVIMIALKATSRQCPHPHWFLLLSRSQSGFVLLAKRGGYLLSWLIIPRNRRSSLTLLGGLIG